MADEKNFQAPAYTAKGASRDKVALPGDLFDGTVHMPAMHQAVKAYLANQRQGTAATRTRGHVAGGNQKPWKQKGTGRARQGSIRAPNWVGGGTVFGPQPRSYAQYVPRQVRALARKSALNARAREDAILIIDAFDFDAPKTSVLKELVDRLGGETKKVLVLTNGAKPNVFLSGRNLPNVHVMPSSDVSTYHILWSDLVLIEEGALTDGGTNGADGEEASETSDVGSRPLAGTRTSGKPAKAAKTRASAPKRETKARSAKAEKKSAARAVKKSAAKAEKKPAAKKAAKKKGK
jgi:large subunit ribosomal protein L4